MSNQPTIDEVAGEGEPSLDVAVIGMAGRFPGARTLAEFWSNIANGVESVAMLTDEEQESLEEAERE